MGAALGLAACGSGGGGTSGSAPTPTPTPTPTPAAVNLAPVFTSSTTERFVENRGIQSFYMAVAKDPEGEAVRYAIIGGADQNFFTMNPTTGGLSFKSRPVFQAHYDANADNIYEVQICATDASDKFTVLDLKVEVVDDVVPARGAVTLLDPTSPLLDQPTYAAQTGDRINKGGYQVALKDGRVISRGVHTWDNQIDIRPIVSTDGDRGLLQINGYSDSPRYLLFTNLNGDIEVRRFPGAAPGNHPLVPADGTTIIKIPHPRNTNIGGWMGFNTDGYLYIAVGDGGAPGTVVNTAQDPNSLLGKVLRIDVNRDDFPSDPDRNYGIPAGNPYATSGGKPEVWALGLRNPASGGFGADGQVFIADRGESQREEVNMIPAGQGGLNFGWPVMEGTLVRSGTPLASFVPPVIEYPHGTGQSEGSAIVWGLSVGSPIPLLEGTYVFADKATGNIWTIYRNLLQQGKTLTPAQFVRRNTEMKPNTGTIDHPTAIAPTAGAFFIVDADGQVFIVTAT